MERGDVNPTTLNADLCLLVELTLRVEATDDRNLCFQKHEVVTVALMACSIARVTLLTAHSNSHFVHPYALGNQAKIEMVTSIMVYCLTLSTGSSRP
jgi:hypothetical protein